MLPYKRVQASWFHVQGFCEYQLYLVLARRIRKLDSEDTLAGEKLHSDLDRNLPTADVGVSNLSERVTFAKENSKPFIVREVDLTGFSLNGRADCIEYHLDRVVIADNKPRPPTGEPFHGDRRQLLAYCLMFQEQFPYLGLPIVAQFRDYNDVTYWSHEFNNMDKEEVKETTQRILSILNECRIPVPVSFKNRNKCKDCRYFSQCDASPLKSK